jgi:hypothetical protein
MWPRGILLILKAMYAGTPEYDPRGMEYWIQDVLVMLMVWTTLNEGIDTGDAVEIIMSRLQPTAVVEMHQKLIMVSPPWGRTLGAMR